MKALIVEDEEIAGRRLQNLLTIIEPKIEIVAILPSVRESELYLRDHEPEIVFLDIQLSDGTAFDLLSTTSINGHLVFTTAYDSYAQRAFEHNAIAYLMKPIQKHDLIQTLKKTNTQPVLSNNIQAIIPHANTYNFLIRYGSRSHVIQSNDIAYIYQKEGLTILVNHKNETLPLNISLAEIMKQVDDKELICVTPDLLIRLDVIREVLHLDQSQVEIIIYPPPDFPMVFDRHEINHVINELNSLSAQTNIYTK